MYGVDYMVVLGFRYWAMVLAALSCMDAPGIARENLT